MKRVFRFLLKAIKWTFIVIIALAMVSALYNLTLPTQSKITEKLSEKEKAYIAEAMNLQLNLGNSVWPGWGEQQIPVMVYNEKYAFLTGYANPPAGWKKMPAEEFRGSDWKPVEDDDFFGEVYYRQPLPNPEIIPENFTVKVGDRWVVTMQTKEYAAVAFYNGFKEELPPVLNAVFPYKIFWNLLMGKAENYIEGMTHEAFHAFQGTVVPARLADGENAARLSSEYPWEQPKNTECWKEETHLLLQAYRSENKDRMHYYTIQFLKKREERRQTANLSEEFIQYEKNREWLEGLAKYAELNIGLEAENNPGYKPVESIKTISDFKNYKNRSSWLKRQVNEVKRTASRPGESRFYYGGMLQALMLDRLMPNWKNSAFDENIYLDDILNKAVENS
ncbi:hypothetical protein [Mariniphaga sp.]|uniref:hypothetical protein n=1 Tax=Mariniphaga sp. TaxID=1954475 RepID=UPI00356412A1